MKKILLFAFFLISINLKSQTLYQLPQCKNFQQFSSWIKNWEKNYCAEWKTAVATTKNSTNLSNKKLQITMKYFNMTFGFSSGHPRAFLRRYATSSDLSDTEVESLLKKLDEAQDRMKEFTDNL